MYSRTIKVKVHFILILELLYRFHPRVLYIDIDVHHGDGVEEAFFVTNRVMTVSFHQYGKDFFPGTGHHDSVGEGDGKHYSLNVPLYPGINDEMFVDLFKDVMAQVIEKFRPDAIVMQCGADSLNEDKLGHFNLSTKGHGACVDYILGLGIPLVLLGGGGYTIQNVARCWTYETAIALGKSLENKLPPNEYSNEYTSPFLHVEVEFFYYVCVLFFSSQILALKTKILWIIFKNSRKVAMID